MPTFKHLTSQAYRDNQRIRILATAAKIDAREELASSGRVIPGPNDLAIHEGRCLHAAVLFLDISGFTDRPQETQEEQELMLRQLSLFFTEMIKIVEDFGGTVEKNTGDGLMAYFANTVQFEASKETVSVAAAITMLHAAKSVINAESSSRGMTPFDFRICIDSGRITLAKMGAAQRFNGVVAIGTTANLACKMLHVAKAGQLMIGNNVAKNLPDDWKRFLLTSTFDTGYVYAVSGDAYRFWYYDGRWTA